MKFPELSDLVSVTVDFVEYFGYVDGVDKGWECPRICVEFFPGMRQWFDLSECKLVEFPK